MIAYMVADLKYNLVDGVKICEVQHGALSALTGDIYLKGNIISNIVSYFNQFEMLKWVTTSTYTPLRLELEKNGWIKHRSFDTLKNDSLFITCCKNNIKAMVYATIDIVNVNIKQYPSIIFIDAVTLPYWKNKYKMNSLITLHKAEWSMHNKNDIYHIDELSVIKPLHECLGNGITIGKDLNIKYWSTTKDQYYLIEKYYQSDYLLIGNNLYDPTMRIVFILNNEKYHLMGAYWKLPPKPIGEGTLNQQHISANHPPYHCVNENTLSIVNEQIKESMCLMYNKMIELYL